MSVCLCVGTGSLRRRRIRRVEVILIRAYNLRNGYVRDMYLSVTCDAFAGKKPNCFCTRLQLWRAEAKHIALVFRGATFPSEKNLASRLDITWYLLQKILAREEIEAKKNPQVRLVYHLGRSVDNLSLQDQ